MCQHIYDVMGCEWNMPANYSPGVFEQCLGDSAEPMGVYGTSTFYQGEPVTPPAHPIPSSSSCTYFSTISNGQGVLIGGITSTVSTASTPTSTTVTGAAKSGTSSSSGSGAPTSTSSSAALPTAPPVGCWRLAVIVLTIVIGFSMGVVLTF
ncbi:hypothetical protein CY34DRAFT_330105 [Suillus luteus UH-Slu-Lm8-n1]|uniref:Uncharacterized protein n=1 Tax=Suillus luteus UH-Slu-Lm8-n1 TaxID=930992 RepID=A0A0D0BM78_9AGAM|nr:hypothetical protein CY34DRAFT_330105 [Suillus luteus UH-Slu-Lm8-n1]